MPTLMERMGLEPVALLGPQYTENPEMIVPNNATALQNYAKSIRFGGLLLRDDVFFATITLSLKHIYLETSYE